MIEIMNRYLIFAFIVLLYSLEIQAAQAPTGILFSPNISASSGLPSTKTLNLVDLDGDGDLDILTESSSGEFFFNDNVSDDFTSAQKLHPQDSTVITVSNLDESIGVFHAFDPDDPRSQENFNFAFVSGDGDSSNDKFILSSDGSLKVRGHLQSGEYSVRVQVTDLTGLSLERTFTFQKEGVLHGMVMTPYMPPSLSTPVDDTVQNASLKETRSMFLVDMDKDGDLDLISEDLVGRFFLNQNQMGEFSRDLPLFPNPIVSFERNSTIGSPVASIVAISSDYLGSQPPLDFQLALDSNFPDNQFFSINSTGTLFLTKSPLSGILRIRVKATNSEGHTTHNTFELEALEPERFSPSNIELSKNSLLENAPKDTVVGHLNAQDDNQDASHVFSLVYPSDDFSVSGLGLVVSKKVFDYESKNSFTLTVKATNQYGKSLEQDIKIEVIDVKEDFDQDGLEDHLDPDDDNDGFTDLQESKLGNNPFNRDDFPQFPPSGILISTNAVEENKPIGSVIGYLEASGSNIGVSHVFELISNSSDFLPITVDKNGSVVVSNLIDYEYETEISFKVRATNEFGLYLDEEFVIDIIDIDEVQKAIPRTSHASSQSDSKFELHGELISDGNSLAVETGFLVGTSMKLTLNDADTFQVVAEHDSENGKFSYILNHQTGGKFFFRSYASNEKGLVLGSIKSFMADEHFNSDAEQYGIWSGFLDSNNGWLTSDWFGALKIYPNGWVFHHELGWLFTSKVEHGVWIWREQNGWVWTGSGIFPFFYNNQSKNWLYYYAGEDGNGYFYDYYTKTLSSADAHEVLHSSDVTDQVAVLSAQNGVVVVEKSGGIYRYKDFEGTTTWTVLQDSSGSWQIRTGYHENGQTFGIEGAYDQLPDGDYMKHSYEIDEDGIYIYQYQWHEDIYSTYYKIHSVDNGVVTSDYGPSKDQLTGKTYFFTDKSKAEKFYNSRLLETVSN